MTSELRCAAGKAFLERLIAACERIAPLKFADSSWDNVGLIAESPLSLRDTSILVTNDLSLPVLQEAIEKRVSAIISYHPPWFKAAKKLPASGPLAVINYCIANGISIYSPHTALDSIRGGINDWMCKAFMEDVSCAVPCVPSTIDPECGFGRIVKLPKPISITEAIAMIKKHFNLDFVRVGMKRNGNGMEEEISTIAVCAGSGGSVFTGAIKADLFVTGEMGHHQVLELCDRVGAYVVLTEHSNCERGYLRDVYCERLRGELGGDVQVFYSQVDTDPLKVQ